MKKILFIVLLILPLTVFGETEEVQSAKKKVLTGYSGGMVLHFGYSFASTPAELFRNNSLEGNEPLPKDGATLGLGGQLRLHLYNHMHIGGEGYMSLMPLAGESSVRTGWGGGLIDGYLTLGRLRPMIGLGMGGGSVHRLYVPSSLSGVVHWGDSIAANASYSKTPFFYVDPYIGLEILLGPARNKSLYLRLDYLLPFGNNKGDVADQSKTWSTFIKPSGPRLYVGIMFGKQK